MYGAREQARGADTAAAATTSLLVHSRSAGGQLVWILLLITGLSAPSSGAPHLPRAHKGTATTLSYCTFPCLAAQSLSSRLAPSTARGIDTAAWEIGGGDLS